MNNCPCCSEVLLRHIRSSRTYWFCRSCWQEMPEFIWQHPSSLAEMIQCELPKGYHNQAENAHNTISTSNRKTISGWIGVKDALV